MPRKRVTSSCGVNPGRILISLRTLVAGGRQYCSDGVETAVITFDMGDRKKRESRDIGGLSWVKRTCHPTALTLG